MTSSSLRQEIIEAMKSVQSFEPDDKGRDAIEVEADNAMEAVERYIASINARMGSKEANE